MLSDMTARRFPDPLDQPTMSVPEAGSWFGLCRSGSYAAAERGDIPTMRFGKKLVVPTARLGQMLGLTGGDA